MTPEELMAVLEIAFRAPRSMGENIFLTGVQSRLQNTLARKVAEQEAAQAAAAASAEKTVAPEA